MDHSFPAPQRLSLVCAGLSPPFGSVDPFVAYLAQGRRADLFGQRDAPRRCKLGRGPRRTPAAPWSSSVSVRDPESLLGGRGGWGVWDHVEQGVT